MGWQLLAGALAGILMDRVSIHKILLEKNSAIEKMQANILILEEWLAMYRCGYSVARVLQDRNLCTVAIYGMGILGNHLYQELNGSAIQIKYIMDKRPIKGVYHAEVCDAKKKISGVDAVIVTPVFQFKEIEKQLCQLNDVQVISLRDLLNAGSFGLEKDIRND